MCVAPVWYCWVPACVAPVWYSREPVGMLPVGYLYDTCRVPVFVTCMIPVGMVLVCQSARRHFPPDVACAPISKVTLIMSLQMVTHNKLNCCAAALRREVRRPAAHSIVFCCPHEAANICDTKSELRPDIICYYE